MQNLHFLMFLEEVRKVRVRTVPVFFDFLGLYWLFCEFYLMKIDYFLLNLEGTKEYELYCPRVALYTLLWSHPCLPNI